MYERSGSSNGAATGADDEEPAPGEDDEPVELGLTSREELFEKFSFSRIPPAAASSFVSFSRFA
jgi:hypothetical protein